MARSPKSTTSQDEIDLHSITPRAPQLIGDGRQHDRSQHIWKEYTTCARSSGSGGPSGGVYYKCVLCGARTLHAPPPSPDPEGWYPDLGYEQLTDAERQMAPPAR